MGESKHMKRMYVDEQLITNETRTPTQVTARGRKAIDLDRVYTDTFLRTG